MKSIAIHDNEPACIKDMSSNFYISESDIGKPRAEVVIPLIVHLQVCLPKLRELNPYVSVTRREEELTEEYVKTFRVCLLCYDQS